MVFRMLHKFPTAVPSLTRHSLTLVFLALFISHFHSMSAYCFVATALWLYGVALCHSRSCCAVSKLPQ